MADDETTETTEETVEDNTRMGKDAEESAGEE